MQRDHDSADIVRMFASGLMAGLLALLAVAGVSWLLDLGSSLNWLAWIAVPPAGLAGVLVARPAGRRPGRGDG